MIVGTMVMETNSLSHNDCQCCIEHIYINVTECIDPLIFFFPVLFLFDWVGVLWPELSKVLKPVLDN